MVQRRVITIPVIPPPPQRYDPENEAQFRRVIETAISRGDREISFILGFTSGSGSLPAGSTQYIGQGAFEVLSKHADLIVPFDALIRNLYVRSQDAPGASETFTYAVLGTPGSFATNITAVISGASETDAEDATNTSRVTRGQRLTIRLITSASAADTEHMGSIELVKI